MFSGGLRLRHKTHVNAAEVIFSDPSGELTEGLDEWHSLNITDSAAQLNNTDLRDLLFVTDCRRIAISEVYWNFGHAFDPIHDGIGHMRNDLDSFAQVVTSTLLVYHLLVYLAGGDVVVLGESDIEEALVIAEVEVNLAAVVQHIHLPCNRGK